MDGQPQPDPVPEHKWKRAFRALSRAYTERTGEVWPEPKAGRRWSNRITIPEDTLRELYLRQGLRAEDIAQRLGYSKNTVILRLQEAGIRRAHPGNYIDIPAEVLRELYVDRMLPAAEIARQYGCSESVIYRRLQKAGIDRRPAWTYPLTSAQQAQRESITQYRRNTRICIPPETLWELYVDKKLPCNEIAKIYGCTGTTIRGKLADAGIPRRRASAYAGKQDAQTVTQTELEKMHRPSRYSDRAVRVAKGYRYVYLPEHHLAEKNGFVPEHRLVAEEKLGRPLQPNEVVHHINHIKYDNRPENLEVMDKKVHYSMHLAQGVEMQKKRWEHDRARFLDELRRYIGQHGPDCVDELAAAFGQTAWWVRGVCSGTVTVVPVAWAGLWSILYTLEEKEAAFGKSN